MSWTLPDCEALGEVFFLTPAQRRELLLLMAERGTEGLEEFVRRHKDDDSAIAHKIARIRAKLEKEAADLRRRLESEYDERRRTERERAEQLMDRLRREGRTLDEREAKMKADLPDEIARRVRTVPLIELAIRKPAKVPWWRRLFAWFRRLWTRFKRWLARLFGRARPEPKAKGLVLGVGGGPGVAVDLDIEEAIALNPQFRRRVRKSMGSTPWARAKRMFKIMLGLEDYADVARRVMEEQARRAATQRQEEIDRDRQSLERERQRVRKKEHEAEEELDEELERLRAVEAEEARQLDEVLRKRPLEDAEHVVAEELEAGGFLDRVGGKIEVTGRFLETVAGLVHAEESRGVSPSHESPLGASVEGEGILEKTPMLAFAEASHMDVVGSLVQARQRHPNVRHLTEDDILVYRERRTSVAHVVVILDRSLSMEENDRMTAAKRAALALYWATTHRNPDNQIDFILMDTHVERASLAECWEAEPRGFTNTGRALEVAGALLRKSRANRRVLFLVTDGLPEAFTEEGEDVAGRPEEALRYALRKAQGLRRIPGLDFRIVLLEPEDPMFVTAATKIANQVGGRVIEVEPQDLASSLLRGFQETQTATTAV